MTKYFFLIILYIQIMLVFSTGSLFTTPIEEMPLQSEFFSACINGNIPELSRLNKQGANINSCMMNGKSALILAVENGHMEVIEWLLDHGVALNIKREHRLNPIMIAADKGNYEIMDRLLEKTNDKKVRLEAYISGMISAIRKQDTDLIQLLLKKGVDANSVLTDIYSRKYGYSLLRIAVSEGLQKSMDCLISNGADVNKVDNCGRTPLLDAAKFGHIEILKYLIDKGANIEYKSHDAEASMMIGNALLEAINFKKTDVVIILLEQNANIEIKDRMGQYAVHYAAMRGLNSILEKIIKRGQDIDKLDYYGRTPLMMAARNGAVETIKFLLEKGADISKKDKMGNTCLIHAVERGHNKVVESLINKGADVNTKNFQGISPLMIAAGKGYLDTIKMLLEKGADLLFTNTSGNSVLDSSIESGQIKAVKFICDYGVQKNNRFNITLKHLAMALNTGKKELIEFVKSRVLFDQLDASEGIATVKAAIKRNNKDILNLLLENSEIKAIAVKEGTLINEFVKSGNMEMVESFIKLGVDLKVKDKDGDTPLLNAIRYNKKEIVEILLNNGADINATDSVGKNSLILAVSKGLVDITRMILEKKVDLSVNTKRGFDVVDYALWSKKPELVDLLKSYGCKIDFTTMEGKWKISDSFDWRDTAFLKYLISLGADVNSKNYNGETALMIVTKKGLVEPFNLLIEKGADLNLQCERGYTPLIWACRNKHSDLVSLLLSHGAIVNVSNRYGMTALAWAICNEDTKLAKQLQQYGADRNNMGVHVQTACRSNDNGDSSLLKIIKLSEPWIDMSSSMKILNNIKEDSKTSAAQMLILDYIHRKKYEVRGFSSCKVDIVPEAVEKYSKLRAGSEEKWNDPAFIAEQLITVKRVSEDRFLENPDNVYRYGLVNQFKRLMIRNDYHEFLRYYWRFDSSLKSMLIRIIWDIGIKNPSLVPFYDEILNNGSQSEKIDAVYGLSKIENADVNPVLLKYLESNAVISELTSVIVQVLAEKGYRDEKIYSLMEELYKNEERMIRFHVYTAATYIADKRVEKYIRPELSESWHKDDARKALEEIASKEEKENAKGSPDK